jgi:hypothetical protein
MLAATEKKPSGIVPLQTAVLCVDCENVSNSSLDVCPVCGGHSLLNIARILGGTLFAQKDKARTPVLFDMEISIQLKDVDASDVTTAVKGITDAIRPSISRGRASFHINLEPVKVVRALYDSRAA